MVILRTSQTQANAQWVLHSVQCTRRSAAGLNAKFLPKPSMNDCQWPSAIYYPRHSWRLVRQKAFKLLELSLRNSSKLWTHIQTMWAHKKDHTGRRLWANTFSRKFSERSVCQSKRSLHEEIIAKKSSLLRSTLWRIASAERNCIRKIWGFYSKFEFRIDLKENFWCKSAEISLRRCSNGDPKWFEFYHLCIIFSLWILNFSKFNFQCANGTVSLKRIKQIKN